MLVVGVAFLLRTFVTNQLNQTVDTMVNIAQGHGNLTHRLDEIKGVVDLVVNSSVALASGR